MALACREVVESLLLFMRLQNGHMSKNTMKQLNPALNIQVTQEGEEHISESQLLKFNVNVLFSGLGAYFIDGHIFLTKLCEHGEALRHLLCSNMHHVSAGDDALMELRTRRIGDCLHVSSFKIEGFSSSDGKQPVIRESVEPRADQLHTTSLLLSYTIFLSNLEELKTEANKLSLQLHFMHLINPEVAITLRGGSVSRPEIICANFEVESYRSLTKTPFKLAMSIHHFINQDMIPTRQSKLHLLKGDTYLMSGIGSPTSSIKIYSAAAVVPHLDLRNGKKIPANRLCKQLHIFVIGPFNIPLISADTQANFPLSSLADWNSYGLDVRQNGDREHGQQSTVTPSFFCELSNTRQSLLGASLHSSTPSNVKANHILVLFIFLEQPSQRQKSLTGDSTQWRHDMELMHQLREGFQNMVVSQSKKFQQTVHSVLNKLICNYGSHAKTSNVLSTAIPLISDAVTSIIRNSSNEEFKRLCREVTEVEDEGDIKEYVNQKLWKMAKDKLRVTEHSELSSRNPDEPTSPEIIQAASNSNGSSNVPHQKKENTSKTTLITGAEKQFKTQLSSSANANEPIDFVQHTLSSSNVLQAMRLSKARDSQDKSSEIKSGGVINDDCFEALELITEHMETGQLHQKEENLSDENVDRESVDIQLGSISHEHMEGGMSSNAAPNNDCIMDTCSPSILQLPCNPDHSATAADEREMNKDSFDELEYFSDNDSECISSLNENPILDTFSDDINKATDKHSSESFSKDKYSEHDIEHPNSTCTQLLTSDNSFNELEYFDHDDSTFVEDAGSLARSNVSDDLDLLTHSDGFDELEHYGDSDSTCMEYTQNHSPMNTSNTTMHPNLPNDKDEIPTLTDLDHDSFNQLECIYEDTSTWSLNKSGCQANTPGSPLGQQCVPIEEAGTYDCSSDEEWDELAYSSSVGSMLPQEGHVSGVDDDEQGELGVCERNEHTNTQELSGESNLVCCVTAEDFNWD